MKKVCWITADYFLDCDLNMEFMSTILKEIQVYWIIIIGQHSRYSETDLRDFNNIENLTIKIIHIKSRARNIHTTYEYLNINNLISKTNSDIIYINVSPASPFLIPFFLLIPSRQSIITSHQGKVHDGMQPKWLFKIIRKITYSHFKYVNMFSKSQSNLFLQDFPLKKIFTFKLGLKDFGIPTIKEKDKKIIRFLSFGTINYAKNIDLLIEAACNLYEKGYNNFVVSINGVCNNWSFYQKKIKYPQIFELDIRMIENTEIANLFAKSHYFVQPYRIVTQSGPMKIAYKYNVPVIVSDLPGFLDELKEGVTGYSFKHENKESLEQTMQDIIDQHTANYEKLRLKMKQYIKEEYSPPMLAQQYIKMFNSID